MSSKFFCSNKSIFLPDTIKSNILENIGKYLIFNKPKSLTKLNDFNDIKYYKLRTNGIKVYLYFHTNNNKYYSYIIEQNTTNKINFIRTKHLVNPEYYNGTLFYGELTLSKNNKWHFLIEKHILYKGKYTNDYIIDNNIQLEYKPDNIIDTIELNISGYNTINHIHNLNLNNLLMNNFCYMGIEFLFNDIYTMYFDNINNIQDTFEETKTEKNIYKNFNVYKSGKPDVYYLNSPTSEELLYIKDINTSLILTNTNKQQFECNCMFNNKFKKWQFINLI